MFSTTCARAGRSEIEGRAVDRERRGVGDVAPAAPARTPSAEKTRAQGALAKALARAAEARAAFERTDAADASGGGREGQALAAPTGAAPAASERRRRGSLRRPTPTKVARIVERFNAAVGAIDTATGDGLAETDDEDVPARAPPPTKSQAGANVSAKDAEEDAIRLPTSDYAQLVAEISTHRAELDVLCDHVGNLRSELKLLSDGLRRSNEVRRARRSAASASPCSPQSRASLLRPRRPTCQCFGVSSRACGGADCFGGPAPVSCIDSSCDVMRTADRAGPRRPLRVPFRASVRVHTGLGGHGGRASASTRGHPRRAHADTRHARQRGANRHEPRRR